MREHSWEAAVGRGWDDSASTCSDDSAADDPARSVAAASEKFVDELLALYTSSTISAQKLCTLCYWATMSGMRGSVTAYAKEPGAQSGAYQRFLDGKLGFRYAKQRSYLLQVPGLPLGAQTRGEVTFPAKPLHELAERALADDPTANVRLQEAIERGAPACVLLAPCRPREPNGACDAVVHLHGLRGLQPRGLGPRGVVLQRDHWPPHARCARPQALGLHLRMSWLVHVLATAPLRPLVSGRARFWPIPAREA